MTTDFVDISHHQGSVDLAAYKAAGYRRISMKATEGTGFTDPKFKERWQAAGKLGLERIAYHFQRAKFDGVKEFDFFLSVVNDAGGFGKYDSIMLDYEDPDTPSRALLGAKRFVGRAVSKGYKVGLLYTYRDYGDRTGLRPELFPEGWRKLVIASYTNIPDNQVRLPAGWTWDQVVARQFTDHAIVPGIGSADDNHLDHEWLTAVDAVSTPTPEELEEAELATAKDDIIDAINHATYILMYGDHAADVNGVDAHPNDLQRIRWEMAQDRAAVAAKFGALMEALKTATGGVVDLSAVEAAAEKGAADALARVQLTVADEAAA